MNPRCPKCGRIMHVAKVTTEKGISEIGDIRVGLSKYWVCSNTSKLHGIVKFKVGSAVIPPYKP